MDLPIQILAFSVLQQVFVTELVGVSVIRIGHLRFFLFAFPSSVHFHGSSHNFPPRYL